MRANKIVSTSISFLLLLLMGCSSSKVYRLMAGGEVVQRQYKEIIPFEMRMGLIIVIVKIQGNDYDFMFDSGAPNVVSFELSEKLKLKSVGKTYTRGSQGQRNKVDYANLELIEIGGIQYSETTAAIMDLKKAVVLDCMELDGILGANVMRNSIWQIDYQKQEITITNSTDSLHFSTNLDTIPFLTKHTGTPVIDVQVGSVMQKRVTLDTGSSGNIDLNYNTYKKSKERLPLMKVTAGYGSSSSGIYGIGTPDTLFYFKTDSIQIGTVQLQDQIVYASLGNTSSTLGTKFLKNYIVTLDWNNSHMVLDSVSTYDFSELDGFGFKPKFEAGELRVGFLFTNSTTGSENLQLNDRIVNVDTTDYSKITKDGFCELILDTNRNEQTKRILTIERGNELKTVELKKSILLK